MAAEQETICAESAQVAAYTGCLTIAGKAHELYAMARLRRDADFCKRK
jgi:hypothetical protein